jgi:hypothetical protein
VPFENPRSVSIDEELTIEPQRLHVLIEESAGFGVN